MIPVGATDFDAAAAPEAPLLDLSADAASVAFMLDAWIVSLYDTNIRPEGARLFGPHVMQSPFAAVQLCCATAPLGPPRPRPD